MKSTGEALNAYAINAIIEKDSSYINIIETILNHESVTHKQKVQFAFYCAKDLDKYYDVKKEHKVYKTRQECLKLVANWILDEKSVTKTQLDAAAYAAANAAANAANASAYAAYAAAYAADHNSEMKLYLCYLLEMLNIRSKLLMLVL